MSNSAVSLALVRALAVSNELFTAAEKGNLESVALLDAERLQLLKSFRQGAPQISGSDRAMLRQIAQLNDRTIGLLEHRKRSKGREMDMAAVGRRAVAAYANNRAQR
jgi:hypothetical protein